MLRPIVQTIALAAACCVATPAVADEPCAVESPVRDIDQSTRIRAMISMIVPSVYATWQAQGGRSIDTRRTEQRLSAPDPVSRETSIQRSSEGSWEVGLTWNPVRIIERSRRIARLRRRRARRRPGPLPEFCRRQTLSSETSETDRSFGARLDRAISREKRDALEAILD
jgi:hypothetical protein